MANILKQIISQILLLKTDIGETKRTSVKAILLLAAL